MTEEATVSFRAEGPAEDRLRRLESVTDLALTQLGIDDLLDELLDRARELLDAHTAAILLLDESRQFLVATAARGIEEEVRQGSRVPLGLGFAGRIAASKHPVAISHVSPRTVVNPVLLYKGIRSMLGVPLLSDGEVLGVLHVGSLVQREFTREETELLELAADRAANALVAERSRSDSAAAVALQRSLAPQRLPVVPGLDLAARYVPGNRAGVGGDWYDVFELPDANLGIAIGDVMGHGLGAATVMGRVRSALRAYALEGAEPHTVLARLDDYIQHFEPAMVVSALYAVLHTETWTIELACAGHVPPVLACPSGDSLLLDGESGVLLGAPTDESRRSLTTTLDPGAALCLFTDGLVERREEDLAASLEHLRRMLGPEPRSADMVCADVMARVVGDRTSDDDIAMLVLRREV